MRPLIATKSSSTCQVSPSCPRRRRSCRAYAGLNERHHWADRFVGDRDPAWGEEVFDVAETEAEPKIEPHGVGDDVGRETISVVARRVALPSCHYSDIVTRDLTMPPGVPPVRRAAPLIGITSSG